MSEKNLGVKELALRLVDELYSEQNASVFSNLTKRNFEDLFISRDTLMKRVVDKLSSYANSDGTELSNEQKEAVLLQVKKEMWGYGLIDELIHDKHISDIKLHSAKRILIKKKGKRSDSGIYFENDEMYESFVTRLLERNKVNLGTANAIQTFTDATQEDFILRITAVSGLLTDSEKTCIAIRKVPKSKYSFKDLEMAGMFRTPCPKASYDNRKLDLKLASNKRLGQILSDCVDSRGIIFTGKGASGKTTLMNAFLSQISHDEAVMICQENAELFDKNHPDILSTHVLNTGGDSKISYCLGDLTRAALLLDMDRVIVGEVKEGQEAAGLSKASMTGHKCWTSVHGEDCAMAIDKMADYIAQATGYSLEESQKQLTGFEYVIHLRGFNVDEIVRIDGWDKEKNALKTVRVYPGGGL